MMSRVKISPLRGVAIVILTIAMPLSFFVSCATEKKDMVEVSFDAQSSYTMKETNITNLISDSGVTKGKMIAATCLIFSKAAEPYWYFPDGFYVEKFDTALNIEASVKADTAYYYERRQIWELIGDVDISNLEGIRFQTQQIFWDVNKKEMYSDSFMRITKGDVVNSGIGFRSNEDLSIYEIYKASADIPVNTQRNSALRDTALTDSLNNEITLITDSAADTIIVNSDNNHITDIQ